MEKQKLKNSRVCLAGRFNAKYGLKHEDLESGKWILESMSKEEYDMMKCYYYPSLLRSMKKIDDNDKQFVYRYRMQLSGQCNKVIVMNGRNNSYEIKNIRLWFFPYNMVLFSIEIEESYEDLSNLTLMHSKWKNWFSKYDEFKTNELDTLLEPLAELTPKNKPSGITYSGTKIRLYQVIQIGKSLTEKEKDELLYEIGTFSSIGVVADTDPAKPFKPSTDYYDQIIRDNTLSVYSNWKALALNDSFTVLTIDEVYSKSEYDEYDNQRKLKETGYHYFEILYMRCLLEKFYCFDRNNLYREATNVDSKKIEKEIAYMEKHYFFEEMSYDFLPPLMYRAMAKGLELQKDREQLTQHVKQALRDARREHMNNAVNFVKIFAVFSAIWTIRAMVIAIWPCIEGRESAFVSAIIALVIVILLFRKPHFFTKLFHSKEN